MINLVARVKERGELTIEQDGKERVTSGRERENG